MGKTGQTVKSGRMSPAPPMGGFRSHLSASAFRSLKKSMMSSHLPILLLSSTAAAVVLTVWDTLERRNRLAASGYWDKESADRIDAFIRKTSNMVAGRAT